MAATSLKARYDNLAMRRDPFLRRAREYAALTIPSLLPPVGHNSSQRLPEPYQGFGARATVNLSSRLQHALLPAGQSCFRYRVPNSLLLKAKTMAPSAEVERGLAMSEKLVMSEIENRNWRQATSLSIQLLIVTGNVLEVMLPDNSIRVFRLDQYVVVRDHAGNLVEVITEEKLSPLALPEEAQGMVDPKKLADAGSEVELFTCYKRQPDGAYKTWQQLEGKTVPKSRGTYANQDQLPVFAIRWAAVPCEDYGRGKVEEHVADLRTLEVYRKSMIEGAAMAARHITLVRPNAAGGNLRQRIAKANNGDVIPGNPDDVHMLQFENVAGLQIVQQDIAALLPGLSAAFLMVGDMRRDAERVTATELRMLAEELEGALGGVYSLLAAEMQKRRITRLTYQMQKQRKLPEWPKGMIEAQITTGLEALGRQEDVRKVLQAGEIVKGMPGSEMYVKFNELLQIAFSGIGLPNAVRTEAEVQEAQQQQLAAEALSSGAGQALGAAGKAAMQQPTGA